MHRVRLDPIPVRYAASVYPQGMGLRRWSGHAGHMESLGRVSSIGQARKRKATGLTDFERQLLLEEVALISAELCDLQVYTASITRRVMAPPNETRVDRTA
jgi:hypothetical protein